jgi:tetratricopeptide (TPR) repeat protein
MTSLLSRLRRPLPLFAAIALLSLALATPADAAQSRLQGIVTDGNGEPLEGVTVTLLSELGGLEMVSTTNRQGRYRFIVVDATHPPYRLRLEKEGFKTLEGVVGLRIGILNKEDVVLAVDESAAPPPTADPSDPTAIPPAAIDHYNKAAGLYNEGDLAGAIAAFEQAVALAPHFEPALRQLGDLYLVDGRGEDALGTADALLALDADDPAAALLRYDALLALGRRDEAEPLLDSLVAGGAEPAETSKRLFNLAVAIQRSGDDDAALARFRQAIELDPQLTEAWAAIAAIELASKRPQKAVDAAAQVLAARPGDVEAMTVQYEAYKTLGEREKAAAMLEQMEGVSQDAGVLYRRGVALFNAGNYTQAVVILRQAVEADPDLAGAHYTLGLALVNQGESAAAVEHLERFLALTPDSPDAASAREMVAYLKAS